MNKYKNQKPEEVRTMDVIPFTQSKNKSDKFSIFLGEIDDTGQVIEKERVGMAFLKQNSKAFRLKLWMFCNHTYFLIPDQSDQTRYTAYSVEEYVTANSESKSFWNKVGEADLFGNYLRIKLNLPSVELFLSLFSHDAQTPQMRAA